MSRPAGAVDESELIRLPDAPRIPAPRSSTENLASAGETTVLLSAGDQLSVAQTLRLAEAVAVLRAKRAALQAGLSRDELDLHTWVVDARPLDAERAPCDMPEGAA